MKYNIIDDSNFLSTSKDDAKGDHLVQYNLPIPKNAIKYIAVPYVPNGFENSCSEASAEMILRYWNIVGWSQYEIHEHGYQTFEGNISVGDLGLLNMYSVEKFKNTKNEDVEFHVKQIENTDLDMIKYYLDHDIPTIVRITTNAYGDRHTIVLIGYSKDGFYYHCNDTGANRLFKLNQFKRDWLKKLIAVYPKGYKL